MNSRWRCWSYASRCAAVGGGTCWDELGCCVCVVVVVVHMTASQQLSRVMARLMLGCWSGNVVLWRRTPHLWCQRELH